MTNAAKHSGCEEVTMSMAIESQKLLVVLSDNGKGFDFNRVTKRGLSNIIRRTEKTGINFEIDTSTKGSTFRLKIILPTQL